MTIPGRVSGLSDQQLVGYQWSYQSVYAPYQTLSRDCLTELRKPQINFRSTLPLVAAVGLGIVAAQVLQ